MTKIALLSDTHIATKIELSAYNQLPGENLRNAIEQMVDFRPQRMVLCGDCAYKVGLSSNYSTLQQLLEPIREIGVSCDFLTGNHDNRQTMTEVLGSSWATDSPVPGLRLGRFEVESAVFLLLDTQIGDLEVSGRIGRRQIEWIRSEIRQLGDSARPVILMGHHHLHDVPREGVSPDIGLRDSAEFREFLDSEPQIRAYFHGHTHSWHHEETPGGTWIVNLPACGFPFDPAISFGWVQAEIDSETMRLKLVSLDPLHPDHGDEVAIALRG